MKVELALDPSQMISLASRVAPAPAGRGAPLARGGRSGGRPRKPRPAKKTAEELDADMNVSSSTLLVGKHAESSLSGVQGHARCSLSSSRSWFGKL